MYRNPKVNIRSDENKDDIDLYKFYTSYYKIYGNKMCELFKV